MEISIKDIMKAVLLRWYVMLAIVSVCLAIGTSVGVSNYNRPSYTASSSFLFSNLPATSNINLYVGNCRAYLLTDYIKYKVTDKIAVQFEENRDYELTIEIISATLSIKVEAQSEAVAKSVLNEYAKIILADDNPIKKDELVIQSLVPVSGREQRPSLNSLIVQIALFGFIGVFIGGLIVLTPLYAEKSKEEKMRNNIE